MPLGQSLRSPEQRKTLASCFSADLMILVIFISFASFARQMPPFAPFLEFKIQSRAKHCKIFARKDSGKQHISSL